VNYYPVCATCGAPAVEMYTYGSNPRLSTETFACGCRVQSVNRTRTKLIPCPLEKDDVTP